MIGIGASEPIQVINSQFPLELSKFSISDEESILSIEFSPFGDLMAGISMSGHVKIWQVIQNSDSWPLLRILRDSHEEAIEEFFTGAFLPNGHFLAAGKRKNRHKWDERTDEPQSLPGLIKIFDLKTGECITRLWDNQNGHLDEILYLKPIKSRQGGNLVVSCGIDGRLCRWSFSNDWSHFKSVQFSKLGGLVFNFDQISDELIAVAVDNGLIIFDIISFKVNVSSSE